MNGLPPGVLSKSNTQSRVGMGSAANDMVIKAVSNCDNVIATDPKGEKGYNAVAYPDAEQYASPLQWMLSMLLYLIPIVNIIYISFTIVKGGSEDKKSWAKGALIVLIISYIAGIVSVIILKNISLMTLFDTYMSIRGNL